MKIVIKKPAECGGLRGSQVVHVETINEKWLIKKMYKVSNLRIALALWLLGENECVLLVPKRAAVKARFKKRCCF